MKGKKIVVRGWQICTDLNSQVYISVYCSKSCGFSNLVIKSPELQDFHLILKCLFHWKYKWNFEKEGFD